MMDEQLKARLIGAIILVVLSVVLIPELLTGRKSAAPEAAADGSGRGMRTYTIDLTGAAPAVPAQPAAPEPKGQPVEPARTQPAPGPVEAAPESSPEPDARRPAAQVAQGPSPAPASVASAPARDTAAGSAASPPPVKGGWSVQVGAFGSAATANKLVGDLRGAGYPAYLAPISKGGKTLHRVRVGPEAARPEADRLAAKLKARGLPATVVAND